MVDLTLLTEMLDSNFEWLAVRESGTALPVRRDEIEVDGRRTRSYQFSDGCGL
jgi:hypothetical protein